MAIRIVLSHMSIAVIAGLGNPGARYAHTRHNVGFDLIENFASACGAKWKKQARFEAEVAEIVRGSRKLLLVKPQTFMNASGRSLGAVLRYHKLTAQNLLVIYDDITLDLARCKLSTTGSAGGHNGITDLLEKVGPGFGRFRIGVGAKPHKAMDLADFVLSQFTEDEKITFKNQMSIYLAHLDRIIDSDMNAAMNCINQRNASEHECN